MTSLESCLPGVGVVGAKEVVSLRQKWQQEPLLVWGQKPEAEGCDSRAPGKQHAAGTGGREETAERCRTVQGGSGFPMLFFCKAVSNIVIECLTVTLME